MLPAQPRILIPRSRLRTAVTRLAAAVRRDYGDHSLLLVGVLKGAFVFLADLMRALAMPVEVDFVQVSSYGRGTVSSGIITIVQDVRMAVTNKDVLLVEDIVDSGYTTQFLLAHLRQRHPASLRLCALLDKPARREVPVPIDYCGFQVPDVFIVGYGIDWNEQYRYLPDICYLEETENVSPTPDRRGQRGSSSRSASL